VTKQVILVRPKAEGYTSSSLKFLGVSSSSNRDRKGLCAFRSQGRGMGQGYWELSSSLAIQNPVFSEITGS